MKYPNYKKYNEIYAKYINPINLSEMMDYAGKSYKRKKFLDLCCGEGEATKEAIKRGSPYCCLVDISSDMVPRKLHRETLKRNYFNNSVASALNLMVWPEQNLYRYDIVFCRQAVNYWLDEHTIKLLSKRMTDNGVFIFNTFNTCPTKKPAIKEYKIKNISFVEISYLTEDDLIHHVQIREGYPPHITEFKWMSKEYFKNCLDKYFNYDIITKNKTDIYKCVKKNNG